MSQVHRRGAAKIEANLTPMIDMTFLLVVFFVLVSQISEIENVEMELPMPQPSASAPPPEETRSVLNVLPGEDGQAIGYRLNLIDFPLGEEGIESMRAELTRLYRTQPDLRINLRADRRTHQKNIDPVFGAINRAAREADRNDAARVNLVVVVDRETPDA